MSCKGFAGEQPLLTQGAWPGKRLGWGKQGLEKAEGDAERGWEGTGRRSGRGMQDECKWTCLLGGVGRCSLTDLLFLPVGRQARGQSLSSLPRLLRYAKVVVRVCAAANPVVCI